MSIAAINDPILKRFRAALDEMYGDRLERVVLFGSRARDDAREDSDYDVAVFLRGMADRWQEFDRLAQALISERAGRVPKTHDGVRSRFNLLTRGDARVDDGIPRC